MHLLASRAANQNEGLCNYNYIVTENLNVHSLWTFFTSKLPSRALLMEDESPVERVERPESVCLPLRSCRLIMTKNRHVVSGEITLITA